MRKLFLFLFAALMSVGMFATTVVTITEADFPTEGEQSFTKDGVTITSSNGFDDTHNLWNPTFTSSVGNFTKIEISAENFQLLGEGWSGNTWTGNASSVSTNGSYVYVFYESITITCTIEEAEPQPGTTLLTTINSDENTDFHSYSKTFGDIAVVTFSRFISNYGDEYGWFLDEENATISVTAVEGYTITSCKFYCYEGNAEDTQAPFEAKLYGLSGDFDDIPQHTEVNGNSIGSYGVTKIEVYGYASEPPTVDVTGVTLSQSEAEMTVGGETLTLTATVNPDNATDKSVTWTSSDANVATVDNGVVTAVAAGTATITVTATNGTDDTADDKTATCAVTVTAPAPQPAEPITVTITKDDFSGNISNSITKDGVTVSAEMLGSTYIQNGTFSTTLGNFIQIEVQALEHDAVGDGWIEDGMKWVGNASSVSFNGYYQDDDLTYKFTIEPAAASEPEPQPVTDPITPYEDPQDASVYYSTFYDSNFKYKLPTGVEAYVADLSGANLLLTKIAEAGEVIPADNAVILKSSVTPVILTQSDAAAVTFTATNDLQGSDTQIATPANCYVLAGTDGVVGFYHYTADNLNAHKAYVVYAGSNQAPRRMPFIFDQATGVESIQPSAVSSQKVIENGQVIIIRNGVRYNAAGQNVK